MDCYNSSLGLDAIQGQKINQISFNILSEHPTFTTVSLHVLPLAPYIDVRGKSFFGKGIKPRIYVVNGIVGCSESVVAISLIF